MTSKTILCKPKGQATNPYSLRQYSPSLTKKQSFDLASRSSQPPIVKRVKACKVKVNQSPTRSSSRNLLNECHNIVDEIEASQKFFDSLMNYEFFDGQFEKIAENCYFGVYDEDYIVFVKNRFGEELDTEDNIQKNKRKHVIKFLFERWLKLIRKFVDENCFKDCKLDHLGAIVIGTIGFENFISTAVVADNEKANEPNSQILPSVSKFAESLNKAYGQKNVAEMDYFAEYAKHNGFLFINTCLSEHFDDVLNSLCTTEFINLLLNRCTNQSLTILDMRLTSFINRKEIDDDLVQDDEFYACSYLGDQYRLHLAPKHYLIRLGSPVRWDDSDDDEKLNLNEKLKEFIERTTKLGYIYQKKAKDNSVK